jgi:hypothetical protein
MKAAIVAHYDPQGIWRDNFLSMLEVLARVAGRIVVVTTSARIGDLPVSLPMVELVRRPNVGYDFYSYRVGYSRLEQERLPDGLYIVNSSLVLLDAERFHGLLVDLGGEERGAALRAVTSSNQFGWHLQSYLLYADLGRLPPGWLAGFLNQVEPQNTKLDTILRNEIGFGRRIEEDGIAAEALFAPQASLQTELERAGVAWSDANWTHWAGVDLAQRWGFAKGELLRNNPHARDLDAVWAVASPALLEGARRAVHDTGSFYSANDKGLTELRHGNQSVIREWVHSNRHRIANAKVAVVLHLFYVDLLTEILEYFDNICEPFDLYISTPFEADIPMILATAARRSRAVSIALTENRGRDVGPFLSVFRSGRFDGYDAVLKVHSKKSLYSDQGKSWRRQILAPLCGDSMTVNRSLALLRRPDVGVVGPSKFFLSNDIYWGANKQRVGQILRAGGVPRADRLPELAFFAGTMFWFKPSALAAIHAMPEEMFDFETENGKQDGTLAHAWERVFCQLSKGAGFRAAAIDCPEDDLFDHDHSAKRVPVLKHQAQ